MGCCSGKQVTAPQEPASKTLPEASHKHEAADSKEVETVKEQCPDTDTQGAKEENIVPAVGSTSAANCEAQAPPTTEQQAGGGDDATVTRQAASEAPPDKLDAAAGDVAQNLSAQPVSLQSAEHTDAPGHASVPAAQCEIEETTQPQANVTKDDVEVSTVEPEVQAVMVVGADEAVVNMGEDEKAGGGMCRVMC